MPDPVSVSVIMPTEARPERAESLRRALQSVLSQEGVRSSPIVVVNGQSAHPPLVDELARARDVRLIRLAAADLPDALRAGRDQVSAPYFAELDDDDELLPGALAMRVEALQARPDVDAVVTRGFLDQDSRREPNVADLEAAQSDPLRALLDHNWLTPCAGLFRSATIGPQYFANIPPYLEWTYIGLRLSLERRILFSNRLTWVYRADTTCSLSKSRNYLLLQPAALERLLALPLPPDARTRLEGRLCKALHAAAELELDAGNQRAAWRWHLRSLAARGGWRYALYTGRLAAALLRSPGARGRLCG